MQTHTTTTLLDTNNIHQNPTNCNKTIIPCNEHLFPLSVLVKKRLSTIFILGLIAQSLFVYYPRVLFLTSSRNMMILPTSSSSSSSAPMLLLVLCLLLAMPFGSSGSVMVVSATSVAAAVAGMARGGAAKAAASANATAANTATPLGVFVKTIMDARRHLVAAAVARSTSIFAMYPVDTIKTRIQMDQQAPFRLAGLYKGVDGSLLGQVPYGVLTFGSYEVYKKALINRFPNTKPIFLYALAAVFGDLTGSGLLCPSEVIKQQMQAGMYSTTTEAFTNILKTKGLPGLYQGYLGGITRDVPFRVAQLTTYEVTKNCYLRLKKYRQAASKTGATTTKRNKKGKEIEKEVELSPVETAICGAVAGTFSAGITSPLDRIKTLLMTDNAAYGGTVISCATKIWQEEGLRGFATGIVPRVTYIAPSVVIFFIAYEQVQQRLKHW